MIEVVISPVVDGDTLGGGAVPVIQIEREQGGHAGAGVVAEVVPTDLAPIVPQTVRVGPRFREQQHAHVFVHVAGEQDDVPRLEIFLTVLDVVHAGGATIAVDFDRGRVRPSDDRQTACIHCLWDRGHRR